MRHPRWKPMVNFHRISFLAVALALVLASSPGFAAESMIEIYRSGVKPVRVAIPLIVGAGGRPAPPELVEKLTLRLRSSLERSGLIEVVDPAAYLEEKSPIDQDPTYSTWGMIGADALIRGAMGFEAGKWLMELRLYDVGLKRYRKGKRFRGTDDQVEAMADRFADVVVEELTGAEGIALSQIAFVSDETKTREIYLMNIDGTGKRPVTQNRSINVSPEFSRDGKRIFFTSYIRRAKPFLYLYEILTGRLQPFWSQGSLSSGGAESPDGKRVAVVQDDGQGNTQIHIYNRETGESFQLTEGYGLSVSPAWSPDGKEIAFTSDRSGGPQVYIVPSTGGKPRRLTFRGTYNTSPAWSPKGGEIAFVRRDGPEFNLYLIDTQGGSEIQLTKGARSNEDPCWSPGGDYLIFSSNRRGNFDLYLMGAGGHFVRPITQTRANEIQPAWSVR
ncbi:MAG: hypothetical protein AB1405_07445 [Bdellovibrionota bacterium]